MELTWTTTILLLKGYGYYRGILLVEVIGNMTTTIINNQLRTSIYLHDDLHMFRQGRGVGTATLKAKLAQHLAGISHKKMFQVFVDVNNSYKFLDRTRHIEIL